MEKSRADQSAPEKGGRRPSPGRSSRGAKTSEAAAPSAGAGLAVEEAPRKANGPTRKATKSLEEIATYIWGKETCPGL